MTRFGPGRYRRSTPPGAVLVLVAGLIAAGCSLPTSDEVQALDPNDYPEIFGSTSTTATTTNTDDPALAVPLYFVSNDQLEKVVRSFPEGLNVNETLQALTEPPTEEEAAEFASNGGGRLVTELPDGLNPTPLELDRETLIYPIMVDPDAEFRQLAIDDTKRARIIASQITCTITDLTLSIDDQSEVKIRGIEIFDSADEEAAPILITDSFATPIDGPLRRQHFNDCVTGTELAEQSASTTSTTTQ